MPIRRITAIDGSLVTVVSDRTTSGPSPWPRLGEGEIEDGAAASVA
jgi:hypothetical protein